MTIFNILSEITQLYKLMVELCDSKTIIYLQVILM